MKKLLAALLFFPALVQAASADGAHRFYGYAFDLKTNAYLYTEVHNEKSRNGKWIGGSVAYYAADGSKLGKKTLSFGKDPYVAVYQLDLPQLGYMESVTDSGNPIRMTRRVKTGEEIETGEIEREGDLVADSGFHSYLVDHFDQLQAGGTLRFRFVVPGYLDTFKFSARKAGDTTLDGQPVVQLDIKPDSMLSLVAPNLTMFYDPETKQMLDYRGTSDIRDPRTGDAYEVHIVYSTKPPVGAPRKLPPLK